MIDEHPNRPFPVGGVPHPLDDELEPGMVFCVESYIGSPGVAPERVCSPHGS
jgi:Xaa-Pro aminopeptidase